MIENSKLFCVAAVGLAILAQPGYTAEVPADTSSRSVATNMAKAQGKMVLLILSDTNTCTGCLTLEFSTLPSTNPPVRQFLGESFIYWACGPEQHCTDYTIYTGTGTIPIPQFYVIDPYKPQAYTASASGGGNAGSFYGWLRNALLTSTAPKISNLTSGQTVRSNNIVVQGRSISTNVPIKTVKYSLNSGAWASLSVTTSPDSRFSIALTPAQVLLGSNTLRVSAVDGTGIYKSRTNVLSFVYDPNATGGTPPTLATIQPSSVTTNAGSQVAFTVAANGDAPLAYQWRLNGGNVAGATGSSYSFQAQSGNAGPYTVVVTNAYGSVTSAIAATLTVTQPPAPIAINTQPQTQATIAGAAVTLTVGATNAAATPMAYFWYSILNGTNALLRYDPPSANVSSSYATAVPGSYFCVVSNQFDLRASAAAGVWAMGDPRIYFGVSVAGPVGGTCLLEYSTALNPSTWTPLSNTTVTLTRSPQVIVDQESVTNHTRRFYRVAFPQ